MMTCVTNGDESEDSQIEGETYPGSLGSGNDGSGDSLPSSRPTRSTGTRDIVISTSSGSTGSSSSSHFGTKNSINTDRSVMPTENQGALSEGGAGGGESGAGDETPQAQAGEDAAGQLENDSVKEGGNSKSGGSDDDQDDADVVGPFPLTGPATAAASSSSTSSFSPLKHLPPSFPSSSIASTSAARRYQAKPGATGMRPTSASSTPGVARRPGLGTGLTMPKSGSGSEKLYPIEGLGPALEPRRPRPSPGSIAGPQPWAGQGMKMRRSGSSTDSLVGIGYRHRVVSWASEATEAGGAGLKPPPTLAQEEERAKAREVEDSLLRQISVRGRWASITSRVAPWVKAAGRYVESRTD